MSYEELKREFNRPSFKKALTAYHGKSCVNCGSDIGVEFHHIVPLADGGTNNLRNIVPLCEKCHNIAHGSKNIRERHRALNTGRPRKELHDLEINVQLFLNCEIGTKELKKRIGISEKQHLTDSKPYMDYLHSIGIKSAKNNVDLLNCPTNSRGELAKYKSTIKYL